MRHISIFLLFIFIFYETGIKGMESQVSSFPTEILGLLVMELPSVIPVLPSTIETLKSFKFVCKRFHSYVSCFEKDYQQVATLIQKLADKHTLMHSFAIAKALNCTAAKLYNDRGNELIEACFEKNLDKVQELLRVGADANFTNVIGNRPLNTALLFHEVWRCREDIEFEFRTSEDWRPSQAYDSVPYTDDENSIIQLLLGKGANLTFTSPDHMFTSTEDMQKYLHTDINIDWWPTIPGWIFSKVTKIGVRKPIKSKVKILFSIYPELQELLKDYMG